MVSHFGNSQVCSLDETTTDDEVQTGRDCLFKVSRYFDRNVDGPRSSKLEVQCGQISTFPTKTSRLFWTHFPRFHPNVHISSES